MKASSNLEEIEESQSDTSSAKIYSEQVYNKRFPRMSAKVNSLKTQANAVLAVGIIVAIITMIIGISRIAEGDDTNIALGIFLMVVGVMIGGAAYAYSEGLKFKAEMIGIVLAIEMNTRGVPLEQQQPPKSIQDEGVEEKSESKVDNVPFLGWHH